MLLDGLTVIDRPTAGTYVYAAQMSTSTPETVCTAYQGGGVTPLPSLLGAGVLRVVICSRRRQGLLPPWAGSFPACRLSPRVATGGSS